MPDDKEADKLNTAIREIIKDIYQVVQSEYKFSVYVCTEDIKNTGTAEFNQIYYSYIVDYCGDKLKIFYGEPGEFWYVDLN